jgi:DNA mismatch endonuclease (patch repair protein)
MSSSKQESFPKSKRSEVMSRIRSRGNKDTEIALAKLFRRQRITGWRRHLEIRGRARSPLRAVARTTGAHGVTRPTFRVRPDFVFPKSRLAVFVDGCFWHGCPRHATKPKNNRAFWRRKFSRNKARDLFVNRELRKLGWRVIRIWECSLQRRPMNCLRRIRQAIAVEVTQRRTEARRLRAFAGAERAAAKARFEQELLGAA